MGWIIIYLLLNLLVLIVAYRNGDHFQKEEISKPLNSIHIFLFGLFIILIALLRHKFNQ